MNTMDELKVLYNEPTLCELKEKNADLEKKIAYNNEVLRYWKSLNKDSVLAMRRFKKDVISYVKATNSQFIGGVRTLDMNKLVVEAREKNIHLNDARQRLELLQEKSKVEQRQFKDQLEKLKRNFHTKCAELNDLTSNNTLLQTVNGSLEAENLKLNEKLKKKDFELNRKEVTISELRRQLETTQQKLARKNQKTKINFKIVNKGGSGDALLAPTTNGKKENAFKVKSRKCYRSLSERKGKLFEKKVKHKGISKTEIGAPVLFTDGEFSQNNCLDPQISTKTSTNRIKSSDFEGIDKENDKVDIENSTLKRKIKKLYNSMGDAKKHLIEFRFRRRRIKKVNISGPTLLSDEAFEHQLQSLGPNSSKKISDSINWDGFEEIDLSDTVEAESPTGDVMKGKAVEIYGSLIKLKRKWFHQCDVDKKQTKAAIQSMDREPEKIVDGRKKQFLKIFNKKRNPSKADSVAEAGPSL